nr:MAG TPA: hypothetical protein [Caudoviricetes sp.]
MKSLELGRIIKNILSQDTQLSRQIGTKIYPLVADKGTIFPFIVYRRDSVTPSSNKDSLVYDVTVRMSLIIASSDYKQGLDLLSRTIDTLLQELPKETDCTDIEILDTSEEYRDDTFLQLLSIGINIKNK